MTYASRSAGLSHKPPTSRFVTDELSVDDLQRYRISKIYIERFASHSHRAPAQFQRRSIFASEDLVMFKPQLGDRMSGFDL